MCFFMAPFHLDWREQKGHLWRVSDEEVEVSRAPESMLVMRVREGGLEGSLAAENMEEGVGWSAPKLR